jgi:hypothetical protein
MSYAVQWLSAVSSLQSVFWCLMLCSPYFVMIWTFLQLRKVAERVRPQLGPKVEERDSLLEQIRTKVPSCIFFFIYFFLSRWHYPLRVEDWCLFSLPFSL